MAEAPFGSVTPIWPSPVFAFGLTQMPIPSGPRPILPVPIPAPQGPTLLSNGPVPGAPGGPMVPIGPYAFNSAVPAYGGLTTATLPALPLADSAPGITPAALLAAIALRRGQPLGPTNENEIEEFIYDALELLSGASDVEVRSEGGRVTLTGGVQHKRLKRDIGEIAWAIPSVQDVQNNVAITTRRRSRTQGRENETPTVARKQA
jgi:BON domain